MEGMTLQEILEKRNAILIKDLSENPPFDKWKKMGQPEVLILADKYGDFELYDDLAYGYLYLLQNGRTIDQSQNDFVQTADLQIIGLGSSFGCEPSALYKRLPWYLVDAGKKRKED